MKHIPQVSIHINFFIKVFLSVLHIASTASFLFHEKVTSFVLYLVDLDFISWYHLIVYTWLYIVYYGACTRVLVTGCNLTRKWISALSMERKENVFIWSLRLRRTASAGQIRRRVDLYRIYFCLYSRTLLPVHREKCLYTTSKATRFNLR